MKILIAEDELAISMQYQIVLEERGHSVIIRENGEECIAAYKVALGIHNDDDDDDPRNRNDNCNVVHCLEQPQSDQQQQTTTTTTIVTSAPFDVVILDYRMPKKDGLAAAIEILDLCPTQRIIFASAYTAETLASAIKHLHRIIEILHKPFDLEYFVDAVEDKTLYEQLDRLNVRVREMNNHSNLTHAQLISLLDGAKKLQNLVLYNT